MYEGTFPAPLCHVKQIFFFPASVVHSSIPHHQLLRPRRYREKISPEIFGLGVGGAAIIADSALVRKFQYPNLVSYSLQGGTAPVYTQFIRQGQGRGFLYLTIPVPKSKTWT